jgi:protein-L-isoaspartate(D-aspartate) O-methyltransferase
MPFDFAQARVNMVENDVRTNDVTDRPLIAAMLEVPREVFVPAGQRDLAYAGLPIAVAPGRHLLDARTFSKLAQAAEIGPDSLVLDVGCATGYSTAVLARLAETVVAVEADAELAKAAEENLARIDAVNAVVIQADLKAGAPEQGPYDVIMLEGMVEEVPESLTAQLKEGGRLMAVVLADGRQGRAMLFQRIDNFVSGRPIFDATVPLLPGFERPKSFVF